MLRSIKYDFKWLPLVLLSIVIFVFFNVWKFFYQQDEWQQLGLITTGFYKANPFAGLSLNQILLGQGRVLSNAIYYFFFTWKPFDPSALIILGLFIHTLNALLLYILGYRLFANRMPAFIAALFFIFNAVSQQAITWVAAFGTLPATTCILGSILLYLRSFDDKHDLWVTYSFILFLLSLLFKEIGIFLILFYPVLFFLYSKKICIRSLFQKTGPFLVYGTIAVAFRLYDLAATTQSIGTLTTGTEGFGSKLLIHLVLYPLTGIAQIFVPPAVFYEWSKSITHLQYPYISSTPLYDLVNNTVVSDLLSIITTFFILSVLGYTLSREKINVKALQFATLLLILSFLPYIVIDRQGSYFDSRYYYVAALGGGLLLGYFAKILWEMRWPFRLLLSALFFALAFFHISDIRSEVTHQLSTSIERQAILQQLKQLLPTLPSKTVIFLSSDTTYITENNYLPFQQGTGYTLMVWYMDTGTIPTKLIRTNYLWELGREGYREVNDSGFGFFTDRTKLIKTCNEYGLKQENIIVLNWSGKRQQLTRNYDVTKFLLNRVGGYPS